MPHWRPMMKQRLQMTIVEPTISTPACRRASPKNLKTRPRKISPKTRAENLTMSPNEPTQSRSSVVHPMRWRSIPEFPSTAAGFPRPGAAVRGADDSVLLDENVAEEERPDPRRHERLDGLRRRVDD